MWITRANPFLIYLNQDDTKNTGDSRGKNKPPPDPQRGSVKALAKPAHPRALSGALAKENPKPLKHPPRGQARAPTTPRLGAWAGF